MKGFHITFALLFLSSVEVKISHMETETIDDQTVYQIAAATVRHLLEVHKNKSKAIEDKVVADLQEATLSEKAGLNAVQFIALYMQDIMVAGINEAKAIEGVSYTSEAPDCIKFFNDIVYGLGDIEEGYTELEGVSIKTAETFMAIEDYVDEVAEGIIQYNTKTKDEMTHSEQVKLAIANLAAKAIGSIVLTGSKEAAKISHKQRAAEEDDGIIRTKAVNSRQAGITVQTAGRISEAIAAASKSIDEYVTAAYQNGGISQAESARLAYFYAISQTFHHLVKYNLARARAISDGTYIV